MVTMNIDRGGPLWKRLTWFVGLWAASVTVVGLVAYALKAWLHP